MLSSSPAPQRGFALLIVLWTLVFVTFLMMQIMASGRSALNLAGNLRAAAAGRAVADGAIDEAIFNLLTAGPGQPMNQAVQVLTVGDEPVRVQVRSLAGMVNPNLASAPLLAGLLEAVAVPPAQAAPLAAAIAGWRSPPDSLADGAAALAAYRRAGRRQGPAAQPFATLGELNDVLGMTPGIYARLVPHMSLYQLGDPDPKLADPVVARALALASAAPGGSGYSGAPAVDVTACLAAGLCRHAVVSLPGLNSFQPYRILAMDDVY